MGTHAWDRLIDGFLTGIVQRPIVLDIALALVAAGIGLVGQPSAAAGTQAGYWIVVVGSCAALVARRSAPLAAMTALAAMLVLHIVVVAEVGVFAAAICMVAAHTTQTQLAGLWRWSFVGLLYAGTAGVLLYPSDQVVPVDPASRPQLLALSWALLTVAALGGALRRRRQAGIDLIRERAAFLETQRHAERRLAAAEERAGIARDLHDILGHSLNTITVQAEGARSVIRSDPDVADQAMATIGRLSRDAVDEIRGLLDVLRADADASDRRPTLTLDDLPQLTEAYRLSGVGLRFTIDGDPREPPALIGQTAYRIAQESITNATRHAPGAPIAVTVVVRRRHVELSISNEFPRKPTHNARSLGGHGLVGMEERVHALGGTFSAGPSHAPDAWRVAAVLPWRRS
ncbi:sensor histidine kinase [Promicromonospora vindobonensis]|uniref:histidine kinase n=1 Tax=Promicromonospora vindobonensis TaxID=195748 RepID=A0ABW5VYS8_9MICO